MSVQIDGWWDTLWQQHFSTSRISEPFAGVHNAFIIHKLSFELKPRGSFPVLHRCERVLPEWWEKVSSAVSTHIEIEGGGKKSVIRGHPWKFDTSARQLVIPVCVSLNRKYVVWL